MKRNTPLRKVSPKQAARNRLLAKLKREMIAEQVKERGYNWCETCGMRCDKTVLELDHKVQRSLGGTDDRDNLQLLDWACHRGKHEAPGHRYRQ